MQKKCVICGTKFESKRVDAETCSPACKLKNWRKNKAAVPATTAIKKTQPTKIETIEKTTAPPVIEEREKRVSTSKFSFKRGPYINDAIRKKTGLKPND